jgi:hypothetical protein
VRELLAKKRSIGEKLSVTDAITLIAAERKIPDSKLRDAYHGRTRAMRKKK